MIFPYINDVGFVCIEFWVSGTTVATKSPNCTGTAHFTTQESEISHFQILKQPITYDSLSLTSLWFIVLIQLYFVHYIIDTIAA